MPKFLTLEKIHVSAEDQAKPIFIIPVWRVDKETGNNHLFLIDSVLLAPDDVVFYGSDDEPGLAGFVGYTRIVDFLRTNEKDISNIVLQDARIPFNDSIRMAALTRKFVDAVREKFTAEDISKSCFILSLQPNPAGKSK